MMTMRKGKVVNLMRGSSWMTQRSKTAGYCRIRPPMKNIVDLYMSIHIPNSQLFHFGPWKVPGIDGAEISQQSTKSMVPQRDWSLI